MAAIISQARRHSLSRTIHSHFSLLVRSPHHRSLCSSSLPPQPNHEHQPDDSTRRPYQNILVQPVSYPVKPSPPPPPPIQQQEFKNTTPDPHPINSGPVSEPQTWTREDIRYVKDFEVGPVSYPARVAPLPEDRTAERNEELEAEIRRIEAVSRETWKGETTRKAFRVDQAEHKLPFPTLIKGTEKNKKEKVVHDLKEAIQLVKANAKRNFVESLEAHVKLTPELRRTDLKLTGSVSLPHGASKPLRVAVFAEGAKADEARAAGADLVGGEELIEEIKNGNIKVQTIDKCIATPDMMPRIGKQISKQLRSLTPNAKNGSVTPDISRAVKEAKQKTEFKKDKSAIVHVGLGKVNVTDEALCENVGAFVNALLLAKPAGLKKSSKYAGYVNTFHICSSMGPSFPVSIQSLSIAADRYSKLQMR